MKITMFLAVPPDMAKKVRAHWREMGGTDTAILPGDDTLQLTFLVEDRDSEDGKLLTVLARELKATPKGPVLLNESRVYDKNDIEAAELLFLDVGSVDGIIDMSSLYIPDICSECGLIQPIRSSELGARLDVRYVQAFDIFNTELLWFVSTELADQLSELTGVVKRIIRSSVEVNNNIFELTASSSLGYPQDGTVWFDNCATCGRRKGKAPNDYQPGFHQYPRHAWNGDDFQVSEVFPQGMFISQRAWQLVSDERWRVPWPGLSVWPVYFVEDDTSESK